MTSHSEFEVTHEERITDLINQWLKDGRSTFRMAKCSDLQGALLEVNQQDLACLKIQLNARVDDITTSIAEGCHSDAGCSLFIYSSIGFTA